MKIPHWMMEDIRIPPRFRYGGGAGCGSNVSKDEPAISIEQLQLLQLANEAKRASQYAVDYPQRILTRNLYEMFALALLDYDQRNADQPLVEAAIKRTRTTIKPASLPERRQPSREELLDLAGTRLNTDLIFHRTVDALTAMAMQEIDAFEEGQRHWRLQQEERARENS